MLVLLSKIPKSFVTSAQHIGIIQIMEYVELCKLLPTPSLRTVPHIAYLWRETPIRGYRNAPIQSVVDRYGLPAAPWWRLL